jgi:3-oxoacyl-[acyl-carrier protein] reductase
VTTIATPPPFDLSGRVAVVTGAGSPTGIGFASARLLGALGAAVAVTSTTARIDERVAELRADGVDAIGLAGDLTDEAFAPRIVDEVLGRWGRLDVLVNNAGMVSEAEPEFESGSIGMPLATWHKSLQRNLDTAFLMTRAAVPAMRDGGWGRVVMVASVTGPVMAMVGDLAYATSKAGMVGLTRALARDLAGSGVTVNAVAPGWIATGSQTPHEHLQGLATPVGRSAEPAEVAATVAWFATPGASYVTGQCLTVDGGNSIVEERATP